MGKPPNRDFRPDDILKGEVVVFYEKGWRHAIVNKMHIPRKDAKKRTPSVWTERHGKIPLDKIFEVYVYDEGKTVKKNYLDTFENLFE